MVGGEWGGGGAGERAGERQAHDVMGEATPAGVIAAQPGKDRAQHVVAGDQRQYGGKAHLEADAQHLPRRDQHDDRRGERQRAQRNRAAADQDAQRDQRGHGETADDGHVGAREHHIEAADHEGRDGCDLLAGPVQRSPFGQRQRSTGHAKDQRHDDADMQAGDGEQVGEAGIAERLAVGGRDGGGVAGEQRRGDGAVLVRQDGADARGNDFAKVLQPARRAVRGGVRGDLGAAQGEAIGADA